MLSPSLSFEEVTCFELPKPHPPTLDVSQHTRAVLIFSCPPYSLPSVDSSVDSGEWGSTNPGVDHNGCLGCSKSTEKGDPARRQGLRGDRRFTQKAKHLIGLMDPFVFSV